MEGGGYFDWYFVFFGKIFIEISKVKVEVSYQNSYQTQNSIAIYVLKNVYFMWSLRFVSSKRF